MLAMAHGSNEINVSAPLLAEVFLLDPKTTVVVIEQEYLCIIIGLISVSLGSITLGKRYLYKFRSHFMQTMLIDGFIANTCVALVLFMSSLMNFTVSCTYILFPSLLLLSKLRSHENINKYKAIQAVIVAIGITVMSAFLSVVTCYILLYLDYNGPNAAFNNLF